MEATAGRDVLALGLTFLSLPPQPVIVKAAAKDKWAHKVGFRGGEEVLELNRRSTSQMTADEFRALVKERPLTMKFRLDTPPSDADPALAALDAQADAFMTSPGGQSATAGIISLMRSRMKAAGLQKFGLKWTKLFDHLDLDHSGLVTWEEFRLAVRNLLKLQEDDVHLRIVFRSLDTDGSGSISQDELVSFVADPLARMRAHLRAAAGLQTSEEWGQFLREQDDSGTGKLDWSRFRALCRDTLRVVDGEEQLWTVYKALATQSQSGGEVAHETLIAFVCEADRSTGSQKRTPSKAMRKQGRAAHAVRTLAVANGALAAAQREAAAHEGRVHITVLAPEYKVGQRDLVALVEDDNPFMQVTVPDGFRPLPVASVDESSDRWLSLTLADWVIVSVRHQGQAQFVSAARETVLCPGMQVRFICRESATATGYPTFATSESQGRELADRLAVDDILPEDLKICRTDFVFKGQSRAKGRVSFRGDNHYVVLKGAKVIRREADFLSFRYSPMDRVRRDFGEPEAILDLPSLDVYYATDSLITAPDGMRLGSGKDGAPGLELRANHGINVVGVAIGQGRGWETQWCPSPDLAVRVGDLLLLVRHQDEHAAEVEGLVHVARIGA